MSSHLWYLVWPLALKQHLVEPTVHILRRCWLMSQLPTPFTITSVRRIQRGHPLLYIYFKHTALWKPPFFLIHPLLHPTSSMSADSYFKLSRNDSSIDEDEVQQCWLTTRNVPCFDILFTSWYKEFMSQLKIYDIQLTKIPMSKSHCCKFVMWRLYSCHKYTTLYFSVIYVTKCTLAC
jgi:hypothetical protein